MKKSTLVITALILLSASVTYAQPRKGDWMVGANVASGVAQLNSTVPHQASFNLNPSAGYFLTNKLSIGTGVNFGFAIFNKGSYAINYGLTPFARYYFVSKEGMNLNKIYVFGELSTSLSGYRYVSKSMNRDENGSGISAGIGPGLGYLITPNVSIEGLLKVNTDYYRFDGGPNQGSGVMPTLGIGFQIYLRGKKKADKVAE